MSRGRHDRPLLDRVVCVLIPLSVLFLCHKMSVSEVASGYGGTQRQKNKRTHEACVDELCVASRLQVGWLVLLPLPLKYLLLCDLRHR